MHEYWAQVALEFGDFKQFDQAAAQLEAKMLLDVTFIGVFGHSLLFATVGDGHTVILNQVKIP